MRFPVSCAFSPRCDIYIPGFTIMWALFYCPFGPVSAFGTATLYITERDARFFLNPAKKGIFPPARFLATERQDDVPHKCIRKKQKKKKGPKLLLQTVKKPLWVVWRAVALQMQSESGDMCGGFGSLAQQGFLAPFSAREPHGGERETA